MTLTYGDRSKGSRGLKVQTFTTDALVFAVYVDLDGKGRFFTPRWPSVPVLGGAVRSVWALAPSVVDAGETFTLGLRSQDALYNRATGADAGLSRARSTASRSPTSPRRRTRSRRSPGLKISTPGIHRFTVESADGAIRATSNPVRVRESAADAARALGRDARPLRLRRGSGHRGRLLPLRQGGFAARLRDALRARLLDGRLRVEDVAGAVAPVDRERHDRVPRLRVDRRCDRAAGTTTCSSARRTTAAFRCRRRAGSQALYAGLRREVDPKDVVVIPHAHMAGDWTKSDAELERLAEIYSMHGTFEWFGNSYLQNGWEVGFVGASDDHRAQPGAPHGLFRLPLAGPGGLAARARAGARRRRDLRRAARALGLRHLGPAHPARRQPQRTPDGHAPARRARAQDRVQRRRHRADRSHRRDQERRDRLQPPLPDRARSTAAPWVLFGLESSSDVYPTAGVTDSPRPYRRWKGTLEVEGARVAEVLGPGLDNVILDQLELDPANPNRVRFNVLTRGRRDALLLKLDGASSGTTFKVQLEPTKEEGIGRPETVRPAADLPAETLSLPFVELRRRSSRARARRSERTRIASRVEVVDRERGAGSRASSTPTSTGCAR